jgi:hypothetical protein
VLLPEEPEPFCLFLDELPACTPDIQKSFYSLLLERRLGEHSLPPGTWVVAAGNRAEDRSLVRSLSAALVNRVIILNVRIDVKEWLVWASQNRVRSEILAFITFYPDALMRPIPTTPSPFSTPRAWASLSKALDLAEGAGILTPEVFRALSFGRISPEDAAVFGVFLEKDFGNLEPPEFYVAHPGEFMEDITTRWFLLHTIRSRLIAGQYNDNSEISAETWNTFFKCLRGEEKAALLIGHVEQWGQLGLDEQILETLFEMTGIAR